MDTSNGLSAVGTLLSYMNQQLGTRAKTVSCRSTIQLMYLSGDDIGGVNRNAYDDVAIIGSLAHELDAWKRRIDIVERRLRDGVIPDDWQDRLETALRRGG